MNKEFIPYEQALSMEKLGFVEKCFGFYTLEGYYFPNTTPLNSLTYGCDAPLYQQAFRWFREKFESTIHIYQYQDTQRWDFDIYDNIPKEEDFCNPSYNTYEEAELACLKKLIEMVNGKEVTSDTHSNYQRGWDAAQRGLLRNDAWGDTYTDNANNRPSHEELDEWIKGWKAYHDSNEIAKNK